MPEPIRTAKLSESQEFYELCQAYRWAEAGDQEGVVSKFENLKKFVINFTDQEVSRQTRELREAAEAMRISMGMWIDFFDGHDDPELCRSQHRHALKLYQSAITPLPSPSGQGEEQ